MKALIPADAVPQDQALIKDARSVQDNINRLNEQGIAHSLKDAATQLEKILPKLKDPKHRTLCIEMMAKIKAVDAKFESGNGNFKDVFNLNTIIRDSLKENFGGGCGESTLPEGKSSSGNLIFKYRFLYFFLAQIQ